MTVSCHVCLCIYIHHRLLCTDTAFYWFTCIQLLCHGFIISSLFLACILPRCKWSRQCYWPGFTMHVYMYIWHGHNFLLVMAGRHESNSIFALPSFVDCHFYFKCQDWIRFLQVKPFVSLVLWVLIWECVFFFIVVVFFFLSFFFLSFFPERLRPSASS